MSYVMLNAYNLYKCFDQCNFNFPSCSTVHTPLSTTCHVSLYPLPVVALQHNDVQVVEVTASHPTQPAEAQNWPKMEDENGVIDGNKNLHYTSITAIQTYPNSFLKNETLFVFLCPRPPC